MLRIGEFSKLARVTVKTLRYWGEVGLLPPSQIDQWTGYRLYTTSQLTDLQRILALRQVGLSIEEIGLVQNGAEQAPLLARRRAELTSQQADLSLQLSRLDRYINALEEGTMVHHITTKTIPAMTVFTARRVISNFAALSQVFPEVGQQVRRDNPQISCPDPGYCFAAFEAQEFTEQDIEITICQEVDQAGVDGEGYLFQDLPPTVVASTVHLGPFDAVGPAFAALYQWIEANGKQPAGPARECYIDGPWNKDNPADYVTEIQVPLAS